MVDERDRRLVQARADAAAALATNPLLMRGWDAIEADLLRQLQDCPATDTVLEHELCNLLRANRKMQRVLVGWLQQGDNAHAAAERREVLAHRVA